MLTQSQVGLPIAAESAERHARSSQWYLDILQSHQAGLGIRVVLGLLQTASWAYGLGVTAHRALYETGILPITRLPAYVIGVGNLTLGGTGKTMAVQAIARRLVESGQQVAVLARGYGGKAEGKGAIVSRGATPLLNAEEAGDESVLTARKVPGAAVLVGKDRRRTGRRAIEEMACETLVLDDAFQYWPLGKDKDVVLVDALNPFGFGRLFPRGLLREPPRALSRADMIWISHSDLVSAEEMALLRSRLEVLSPNTPVHATCHRLRGLYHLDSRQWMALEHLRNQRVAALSGIGSPQSFEALLQRAGAASVIPVRFPDHHRFKASELQGLRRELTDTCDIVMTTEKDALRLPPDASKLLGQPAWVAKVELVSAPDEPPLEEIIGSLVKSKDESHSEQAQSVDAQ